MAKKIKAQVKNSQKNSIFDKTLKKSKIESLPQNVRDSIPFKSVMPNGIIETYPGTFTKSYRLDDVNFNMATRDEQAQIYGNFMGFLDSFDSSTKWQFTIFNHKVPKLATLEKLRLQPQNDGLNKYREELSRYKAHCLRAGSKSITREKYLTVSIDDLNSEHAAATLRQIDSEVNDELRKITKKETKPLSTMKRLELLYNIYNQDTDYRFNVSEFKQKDSISLKEIEAQGLSVKDYVGPSNLGMNFAPYDHFRLGNTYCKVFYLSRLANKMRTTFLSEIANIPANMIISINAEKLNPEDAVNLVSGRLVEIESQVEDIETTSRSKGETPFFSPELRRKHANAYEVENDVTSNDQSVIFMSVFTCIFASSKEELDDITRQITVISQKRNCPFNSIGFHQSEPAFNSCLPLCRNDMFFDLFFTTESAAVFIPFDSVRIDEKNAVFYGNEPKTHNMIFCDRLSGRNYNGLYFGSSGSGKSFNVKYEMGSLYLSRNDIDFFIVDPSSEYIDFCKAFGGTVIKFAPGINNFINPLDLDLSSSSENSDLIAAKTDFVLAMLDVMAGDGRHLDPACYSIIDRCVRRIYKPYIATMKSRTDGVTNDPSIAPTLCDLYHAFKEVDNIYAEQLADILEIYAVGSLNTFAHRTNVETNSRMTVYDIQALRGMKELALFICTDNIFNATIKNFNESGKYTYSCFDEFHILLDSPTITKSILRMWKMFRKWRGVPTGILQNTTDLLRNADTSNIVNNTSFVMMKQSETLDVINLQKLFGLSESQAQVLTTGDIFKGLIRRGATILPFEMKFPDNTELFKILQTTQRKEEMAG